LPTRARGTLPVRPADELGGALRDDENIARSREGRRPTDSSTAFLRNEANPQGSNSLDINVLVGVAQHHWKPNHVVKRAQGGSDFDLDRLVALCRPCHAQTDAPYRRGRLVVTSLGGGRFTFAIIRGPDKWATHDDREELRVRYRDTIPPEPARRVVAPLGGGRGRLRQTAKREWLRMP
jgi:hypothetical protein